MLWLLILSGEARGPSVSPTDGPGTTSQVVARSPRRRGPPARGERARQARGGAPRGGGAAQRDAAVLHGAPRGRRPPLPQPALGKAAPRWLRACGREHSSCCARMLRAWRPSAAGRRRLAAPQLTSQPASQPRRPARWRGGRSPQPVRHRAGRRERQQRAGSRVRAGAAWQAGMPRQGGARRGRGAGAGDRTRAEGSRNAA